MFRLFKKTGLAELNELYFPTEPIDWKEPWWCLEANLKTRDGIQKELNAEVGPKHPLWGLKPVVIGKTDSNDDVIVHLNDQRYACVHLVWHGKIDQIPEKYPSTIIFETVDELQIYIDEDAQEYT